MQNFRPLSVHVRFHQNFDFNKFLLIKLYNILAIKSAEELPFMTLKSCAKFKEKLIFDVENDISNIANYTLEIIEYHN